MLRSPFFTFTILLLSVFLTNCGPVKRHSRLVKKYPFLLTKDTIIQRDTLTFFVEKNEVDTAFFIDTFMIELRDTIEIVKDRFKVKMYAVHDSIFINGECDTVIIEKIIERKIPVVHYKKNEGLSLKKYLIIILIILSLIFIIKLFRK